MLTPSGGLVLSGLMSVNTSGGTTSGGTSASAAIVGAGNAAMWFFALAVAFVFLVLAAQYESWNLPLAVILVVPMCLLCSVLGVQLAGIELTIFTQIGFIVLVGLANKNAILIVEFAKQQQEAGAEMRRSLGVAVFAGMLGVTLFGILLTPVFYYVIQWFGRGQKK